MAGNCATNEGFEKKQTRKQWPLKTFDNNYLLKIFLVINYADVSLNPLKLAQALTRTIKNIFKMICILMGVGVGGGSLTMT